MTRFSLPTSTTFIAVLSCLLLAGIAGHCRISPSNDAFLVAVEGEVVLIEKVSESKLDPAAIKDKPLLMQPGQLIQTGADGRAELKFRSGMIVRIGPASSYRFTSSALIGDLKRFRYRISLEKGSTYFKSDKMRAGTEYIIEGPVATASVRGTEFVMTASEEYSEILVREGQVDVAAVVGDQKAQVKAGQKALVDRAGNITVSQMTDADNGKFDIMTAKLGDRKIDESKELASDDEIRAHYGRLFEVQLTDERVYNGYIVRKGSQVKIHTSYGVIELDNSMIQNVKEL